VYCRIAFHGETILHDLKKILKMLLEADSGFITEGSNLPSVIREN